jgi:hypothetical protein
VNIRYCLRNKGILIFSILLICLSFPLFNNVYSSLASPDYTYYGVVPAEIHRYILADWSDFQYAWENLSSGWILGPDTSTLLSGSIAQNGLMVATKSLLAIVAYEDGTNVEVYDLVTSIRVSQGNLNSMGKLLVLLDNGTHFKVVSDKMVSVELLNYQQIPSSDVSAGPLIHAYYTSVNGLYVDKEFVLMASEQVGLYTEKGYGAFYTILAVEKSTVTVTDDEGGSDSYSLDANSYKCIMLEPFKAYRIESTGNIMVQSGTIPGPGNYGGESCFPIPAATGGFVGTFFLSRANRESWDNVKDYGFMILASQDTKVKVFNLDTLESNEISVTGGSGTMIKPLCTAIALQSDNPITVCFTDSGNIEQAKAQQGGTYAGYGNGVMFMGIRPNQNTMIYLPTEAKVESFFFASEETQLMIDGNTYTLQPNVGYKYTMPGTHTIQSNHDVIVQINFCPIVPPNQGLWFRGTVIPCIETVSNNPTVTITPLGEGFPMMYVIVGAGVAAIIVVVVVLMMRKHGGKHS